MASPPPLRSSDCNPPDVKPLITARRARAAGAVVLAIGAVVYAIDSIPTFDRRGWWPWLVVVTSVALFATAFLGHGVAAEWTAAFAGVVGAAGGVLQYQVWNGSSRWASWAYLWPMVAIGGPGAGLLLYTIFRRHDRWRVGLATLLSGIAASAAGAVVLEGIFHLTGLSPQVRETSGAIFPAMAVGLALTLLIVALRVLARGRTRGTGE
jgi:hypothetical protein